MVCTAHVKTGGVDPFHADMEQIGVVLGQSDDVHFALKTVNGSSSPPTRTVRVSGSSSLANELEVLSGLAATLIYLIPLAGGNSAFMLDKPVRWMIPRNPML